MNTNHIKAMITMTVLTLFLASGIGFFQVLAAIILTMTTLLVSLLVFGLSKSEDFKRLLIICGAKNKQDFIKRSVYTKSPQPWIWNFALNLPVFAALVMVFPTFGVMLLALKLVNDYNFIKGICDEDFIASIPDGVEFYKATKTKYMHEVRDTLLVKYKDSPKIVEFLKEIK